VATSIRKSKFHSFFNDLKNQASSMKYSIFCFHFLLPPKKNSIGVFGDFCIGEEPKYRPFRDLRAVPKAGRPREQAENHVRACTQALS
jgi:hypothetical protein